MVREISVDDFAAPPPGSKPNRSIRPGMQASLALHAVVFPSRSAVEALDSSCVAALHAIRVALEKAETGNPGITHELVDAILDIEQVKGGVDSTEKLLRAALLDIPDYRVPLKVGWQRIGRF